MQGKSSVFPFYLDVDMPEMKEIKRILDGPYGAAAIGPRHIVWLVNQVERYKRMKEELIVSFFAFILLALVCYSIETFTDPQCIPTGSYQVVTLLESNGHNEVRVEDEYQCTKPLSSYKSWRVRH